MNKGEEEIILRFPLRPDEGQEETEPEDNPGEIEPTEVQEAIKVMTAIIESQRAEKAEKGLPYYEAYGPDAHAILREKGIDIPEPANFHYETFRQRDRFSVVATALPRSGMEGRISYDSETGWWLAFGDIRQEWLP